MDFHTLTKKQAHTLCQISKRNLVSSFFEPLLTMRELEALRLIELVKADDFDSGLGYRLNHAGRVLATKPAGTEYCASETSVVIRYEPAPEPDCTEELRKKERECVDLQNQLQTAKNNIAWYERELEKVKAEVRSIQAANHRQYDTIMEKNTVIANLQRTCNDYADRNKVNLQVIRNLEARQAAADTKVWLPAYSNEMPMPAEERLAPGEYVFRKKCSGYYLTWYTRVDEIGWADDYLRHHRRLKDIDFCHYMKLPD